MFKLGTTEYFLTAMEDHNTGEVGLVFNAMAELDTPFATMNGTLMAHDLIEHVNGIDAIGTVSDEFIALGATHYTRLQSGHMVTEEGLAGDLCSMVHEVYDGLGPVIPPQPESDQDASFMWIIEKFKTDVVLELEEEDLEQFPMDEYCDQALQGMRLGEAKQMERFLTEYEAREAFQMIEDTVNQYFGVESRYRAGARMAFEVEEGCEFKLTIINDEEKGLNVFFEEHFPWDDEEDFD